jgi:hypothetical protein
MTTLHAFIQEYINDLQALLDKYPDEVAFINAAEKKWDTHDSRLTFIFNMRHALSTHSKDMGGTEDSEEFRENVAIRGKKGV